jgi:hypothetical protein
MTFPWWLVVIALAGFGRMTYCWGKQDGKKENDDFRDKPFKFS